MQLVLGNKGDRGLPTSDQSQASQQLSSQSPLQHENFTVDYQGGISPQLVRFDQPARCLFSCSHSFGAAACLAFHSVSNRSLSVSGFAFQPHFCPLDLLREVAQFVHCCGINKYVTLAIYQYIHPNHSSQAIHPLNSILSFYSTGKPTIDIKEPYMPCFGKLVCSSQYDINNLNDMIMTIINYSPRSVFV